ncbi:outer membrane protein with beta-barrel domain [Kordia periserrulae]|uniref:Outer membrane protein with beta-barrel domain n=1 Tax=Kordia periserrulae TaxID=701523 RepID=A0A2T6C3A8_9FLAO|nr:outer membrane beta-barrel protein [Kordia periserrulae]PTX62810.1 outer membrane protein with beta-barrel domain [Kordia periserrulae]
MKKLISCLLLLCFYVGMAQNNERKFDIGFHYPLSTGDNFMVFAYDGLLGLDLRYQFADTKLISPKIAFTADYFIYNFVEGINGGALVLKPRIIGEFNIKKFARLKPFVLLGYGFFETSLNTANRNFSFGSPNPTIEPNGERFTDSQNGINWGFGAAYDASESFYIEVTADFIKLDLDGDTSGNRYNENIHTVSFGVGFRF